MELVPLNRIKLPSTLIAVPENSNFLQQKLLVNKQLLLSKKLLFCGTAIIPELYSLYQCTWRFYPVERDQFHTFLGGTFQKNTLQDVRRKKIYLITYSHFVENCVNEIQLNCRVCRHSRIVSLLSTVQLSFSCYVTIPR